jgi:hypothetical protein
VVISCQLALLSKRYSWSVISFSARVVQQRPAYWHYS